MRRSARISISVVKYAVKYVVKCYAHLGKFFQLHPHRLLFLRVRSCCLVFLFRLVLALVALFARLVLLAPRVLLLLLSVSLGP